MATGHEKMSNFRGFIAVLITATSLAECGGAAIPGRGEPRLLTGIQMDAVCAGSATAVAEGGALAVGGASPQTTGGTSTMASAGLPVFRAPFLNLRTQNNASSQVAVSASHRNCGRCLHPHCCGWGRRGSPDRCRRNSESCGNREQQCERQHAFLRSERRAS